MTLDALNALDSLTAERALTRCCGSPRWVAKMAAARPFASLEAMIAIGQAIWSDLDPGEWLVAFAAHPQIGSGEGSGIGGAALVNGDVPARGWACEEQAGARSAPPGALERLAMKNREYLVRFGYIFIVCATGRSGDELERALDQRLMNDPETELRIAADQQRQITALRLAKLLETDAVP